VTIATQAAEEAKQQYATRDLAEGKADSHHAEEGVVVHAGVENTPSLHPRNAPHAKRFSLKRFFPSQTTNTSSQQEAGESVAKGKAAYTIDNGASTSEGGSSSGREPHAAAVAAAVERQHVAFQNKHMYSVFFLAFVSVFREGVEAVVFVFGVGVNTAITAIPLAAVAGETVFRMVGATYLGDF